MKTLTYDLIVSCNNYHKYMSLWLANVDSFVMKETRTLYKILGLHSLCIVCRIICVVIAVFARQ